jgi:hypothetical protein
MKRQRYCTQSRYVVIMGKLASEGEPNWIYSLGKNIVFLKERGESVVVTIIWKH